MGLFKTWKQLKAVGQAANEAASRDSGTTVDRHQGFAAAFSNVLFQALGPQMAAMAPRRGGPLAGSEPAVENGSAWSGAVDGAVPAVRARDAAFDPGPLVTFADQVFAALAAVWAGANAGTVRSVMSDDLWEPIAAATATGKQVPAAHLLAQEVGQGHLSGLHAGAWYDSAQVTFQVSLRDGPPEGAPPEAAEWQEEWLFQRSVLPGGDPMARPETCPSCGAPTEIDATGLCARCHQAVPYLTTGWLLTATVSHNIVQQMMQEQMVQRLREDPDALRHMPPAMLKLLPPDLQTESPPRIQPAPRTEPAP